MRSKFALLALTFCVAGFGCGDVDDDNIELRENTPRIHFWVDPLPQAGGVTEVESNHAAYGDPFRVVVDGLKPNSRISILTDSYGYGSSADFVVSADGSVDLGRDAPIAGDWSGADADAMLWSMTAQGDTPDELDLTVTVRVVSDGKELTRAALGRATLDEGIIYEPVHSGRTQGAFCAPMNASEPLPAVLVFGGSEGGTGTGTFTCRYLAQLGFAALGVGYFAAPGLPSNLVQVPLEILEEDLQYLAADARVDAERIAVMGSSRGGELALLLAAHFPIVKAVVAQVPSGIVIGGMAYPEVAAWTLNNEDIAYLGMHGGQPEVVRDAEGNTHQSDSPAYLWALAAASADEYTNALIPVENIRGPVLLLAGVDDQVWPSCVMADIAYQCLQSSGHSQMYADQSKCYADAGHAITAFPGWSTMGSVERDFGNGTFMVLGGSPEGNAHAQRDANTELRRFLDLALNARN